MIIYNASFGDYYILLYGISHYKVYYKSRKLKLEVYNKLLKDPSVAETLTEDDYNVYDRLDSTHVTLLKAVVSIFKKNTIHKKGANKITLTHILKELNELINEIVKHK